MKMLKVVKFGGSSLASAEQFKKVADIIHADESRRYVVPSAPGKRFKEDVKVTDMLYDCYGVASKGYDFSDIFDDIKARYQEIIDDLGLDLSLEKEFANIEAAFRARAGRDYAASRGEYLNGIILANYLGYEFVDAVVGGVVPREYIPVTDKGLQEAMAGGILAGYPVVDVKATLFDGSYHDVDSSEMAFKIAASMALKEAKNKCKPVLLEPIMKVDVTVPDEYFGNVMGDLTSRRGKPLGQENVGNAIKLSAMVPLAEMFGYATSLRSNSQGRGNFIMQFDHYEEVPKNIAEEIIKKSGN